MVTPCLRLPPHAVCIYLDAAIGGLVLWNSAADNARLGSLGQNFSSGPKLRSGPLYTTNWAINAEITVYNST